MISFLVFRTIPNEVFQFIPADEFDIEEDIQSCDDVEDYCLDPWIGIIMILIFLIVHWGRTNSQRFYKVFKQILLS